MKSLNKGLLENFSLKGVALLISVVLWGTVFWSRRVEISKEVPIDIRTAKDLSVSNEVPEKVVYRLSGPNAFLRVIQDRREDPIKINLTEATPGSVNYRLYAESLRVPVGVKVIGVSPSSLNFQIERVKRKEVSVRLEVRGTSAPSEKVTKISIKPDRVWIKGPESLIENTKSLSTIPVDLAEIHQSGEFPIPLDLVSNKIIVENGPVLVKSEVEGPVANTRLKGVSIEVDGFSGSEMRLSESAATVYFNAPSGLKKVLTSQDARVFVDVKDLEAGTHSVRVQVKLPPQSVLVKVVPDRVNIVIK